MNLQRDAIILIASPVSHTVRKKLWAVPHSVPKFITCSSAAIYDLFPHQWVVLINGSKQRVWQQRRHTLHKFAQCVVHHRKQKPVELGQLWHWQQFLQISPAVVRMIAIGTNAPQLVNGSNIQAALFVELEVSTHQPHHLLQRLRSEVPPQHHNHHRANPILA